MARNHRDPPEENDSIVQLDRLICAKCGSPDFNLGIASSDDPCAHCNGFLVSRCAECMYVTCINCAAADILEARKTAGVDLLAPAQTMKLPLAGDN
jgi:hypothetical protein